MKIISFSFLILSIALLPNLLSASLGFIVAIGLVLLSRIPFSFVLRHLRWVIIFLLFFFIILPLTVPADKVIRLSFLTVSWQGLRLASLIGLRAISICMIIFPMVGTMEFHKTVRALESLKFPNKLVQIIMFTYRYIFVLLEELIRMLRAAQARLFKKKADIYTLKIIGNLTGMLFIRAFERTQRVYNAMVSRGYRGSIKTLDEFKLTKKDFLKALPIITLAIMLNLIR